MSSINEIGTMELKISKLKNKKSNNFVLNDQFYVISKA